MSFKEIRIIVGKTLPIDKEKKILLQGRLSQLTPVKLIIVL